MNALIAGNKSFNRSNVAAMPAICNEDGVLHVHASDGEPLLWEATPLLTVAGAYTAGDMIGALNTSETLFKTGRWAARLNMIRIADLANQKAALYLVFFGVPPDAGTFTDNSAIALSTDNVRVSAVVAIEATDYVTIGSAAYACLGDMNLMVSGPTSGTTKSLAMAVVSRGTPTYAAGDLRIQNWLGLQAVPASGNAIGSV